MKRFCQLKGKRNDPDRPQEPTDATENEQAHELRVAAGRFVMRGCARTGQLAALQKLISEGVTVRVEIKLEATTKDGITAFAETPLGDVTF